MYGVNKLNADEASSLERRFTEEEIWNAVRDCGRDKSPGPDGFTMEFIVHFWGLLKHYLMALLDRFWEESEFGHGCNASFLTLVPKVANPLSLNDFRPISLIGITYKIIAKVLADTLKRVIGSVISEVQSAFIKGRSILDGVLIANEMVSYLKMLKRKGMIFKVDFEKAGDAWCWKLDWRREPRGREIGELEELLNLIRGIQVERGKSDRITWRLDPINGFSVKALRVMIEEARGRGFDAQNKTIWLNAVPKKICIFMWRLKRRRIPVRAEIAKRGIDLDSTLCPRCGSEVETIDHALVNCPSVKMLWRSVGRWWNLDSDGCRTLEDIWELGKQRGNNERGVKRWVATSWCFLYLIWAERNRLIFEQDKSSLENRFLPFQRRSFEWITRRDKELALDWKSWLTDPFGV
ncbi:hypothetical protein OSB04_012984 [Centaurea solstitialis]|uniref:Reverse transcriptase domain-containing protein n=1 Tax=Centaurea solstitialis TaxID=347529 RepID=A0AA38TP36_9ASTR|nr:hypothetical protein OSB04_012984 [Centaurea solstitialis]